MFFRKALIMAADRRRMIDAKTKKESRQRLQLNQAGKPYRAPRPGTASTIAMILPALQLTNQHSTQMHDPS
jgi:hypothetical protein